MLTSTGLVLYVAEQERLAIFWGEGGMVLGLVPKNVSGANFTARIPIMLSVCNSGYFCITTGIDLSPALSIYFFCS